MPGFIKCIKNSAIDKIQNQNNIEYHGIGKQILAKCHDKLKKEETGPGSQSLFLIGNTTLTQLFNYIVDIKIGNSTNIDSFDVYINDDYYGSDLELIQINPGDVLRIDVVKTDVSKESTIQFIDNIF